MSTRINISKKTKPKTKVILTRPKVKKNRRRNRDNKQITMKDCYAHCLQDPYTHPPIRLGMGTMVPTNLATLTFRGVATASADGSFAVFCSPVMGGADAANAAPLHFNSAGLAVATWSHIAWNNRSAYSNIIGEARVISCALKVTPIISMTAAPPIAYAGSLIGLSTANIYSKTITELLGFTILSSKVTRSTVGARSRPVDNDAYVFRYATATGGEVIALETSTPTVLYTGLPASCTLSIEAILHLEYIPTNSNSANLNEAHPLTNHPTASSFFPSTEKMWEYINERISAPGVLDGVFDASVGVVNAYVVGTTARQRLQLMD